MAERWRALGGRWAGAERARRGLAVRPSRGLQVARPVGLLEDLAEAVAGLAHAGCGTCAEAASGTGQRGTEHSNTLRWCRKR